MKNKSIGVLMWFAYLLDEIYNERKESSREEKKKQIKLIFSYIEQFLRESVSTKNETVDLVVMFSNLLDVVYNREDVDWETKHNQITNVLSQIESRLMDSV